MTTTDTDPRTTSAGEPDPIDAATRRRWVEENCRRNGDPTPKEIATRCLMIRAGWDAREELARRGVAYEAFNQENEVVYMPSYNPMSVGMPTSATRRNGRRAVRRVS